MELERAIEYAKQQGYISAEYLCEWNGYSCYEPLFSAEEYDCPTGLPYVVMIKGNEIRMSTAEESLQIGM